MSTAHDSNKVSTQKPATKDQTSSPHYTEGQMVSFQSGTLVLKNKDGKDVSQTVAKGAKITCDGVICKPEDLEAGGRIRATTQPGDHSVISAVEGLRRNLEFAPSL